MTEPDLKPAETILSTSRLILEPLLARHAEILFAHLSDAALYTYMPHQPPASAASLAERYQRLESRRSADGSAIWLNWAVRLAGGEEYVGYVQASVEADGQAMLAYFVFAPYQRQGYAVEMCTKVRDYLFSAFAASSVCALIDTRNRASIALVERMGFQREAVLPNADYFKNANSDEYRYRYAKST
ncbi:RimJ/RimL family protein N-acetyltransferase [Collimonas sp. PA-H2]|uniref:GNAT family N-acetyltransferase n=1 Tax=Collimonas sp. PA-H2 TaxID=1881062 RepID=UPI000C0150C6|nr:GNAT family N-acetyltransferase [Collimonas sp. PA-H2]PFH08557.1 RimJ/RimL family protein N-acetyltransferase [Collimonas sp. PA-H2]